MQYNIRYYAIICYNTIQHELLVYVVIYYSLCSQPFSGLETRLRLPDFELRSISEISSCFLGPRPWHIEIRHRVKKSSTINSFGFETLKLKIRRLKLWKPTVVDDGCNQGHTSRCSGRQGRGPDA